MVLQSETLATDNICIVLRISFFIYLFILNFLLKIIKVIKTVYSDFSKKPNHILFEYFDLLTQASKLCFTLLQNDCPLSCLKVFKTLTL